MPLRNLAPPPTELRPAVPLGASGTLLLISYVLVVFLGVVSHEPWFDEAQGWLLARDASVGDLLSTYLRYEGHPPLWYLLLALPAKLGFPYLTGNVLAATCMALGVLLFLRLPSVPAAVRVLVPFGFFIVYQYSVIARSYALLFPILMALAHVYPRRREKVLTVSLLFIALSGVSLHGMVMAWAFAALYAFELWARGPRLDAEERLRHVLAAALLAASTAALLVVLWPPDDLLIAGQLNVPRMMGLAGRVFQLGVLGMFSAWWPVSLAMLGIYLLWFWRQRQLLTFLAPAGGVFLITSIYSNRWHEGLFFLLWLFVLLLSLRRPAPPLLRQAVLLITAAVLSQHVVWGARTLGHDLYEPYSSSREVADFLRVNDLVDKQVYGVGFSCLALQPYFDQPLFDNYRTTGGFTFWDWSTRTPYFHPAAGRTVGEMRAWLDRQVADRPEIFIVGLKFRSEYFFLEWLQEQPDYRMVREFKGGLYWKDSLVELENYAVLVRVRPARASAADSGGDS